jgi:hypothetical protein
LSFFIFLLLEIKVILKSNLYVFTVRQE